MFATKITGLPERRRTSTTASSVAVAPTMASTTKATASASLMARSACAAIAAAIPLTLTSQPPVSMRMKRFPFQSASYVTRSRVTPGRSSTTASRRPIMRFTKVDLPTFGLPTTARTGQPAVFDTCVRSAKSSSNSPNSALAAARARSKTASSANGSGSSCASSKAGRSTSSSSPSMETQPSVMPFLLSLFRSSIYSSLAHLFAYLLEGG
ncbi:unannotated protein [freshwater metagenome]|uniref:Unannotated protein n=1 Tax=freshwater metagenome TaxID=449393 RepID=A0A6J7FKA9_9ZZZZ